MTVALLCLPLAIYQQSVVMFGHRDSGVTRVAGEILTASEDDKAVCVRVRMTGRQTPIGKLFQQRFRVMAFRRPALESKRRRIL